MYKYLIIILLGGITYTQCNDFLESQCTINSNCEWIEDIEIINCSTLSTTGWGPESCEYYYPDCYEYLDYGGWYGSWSNECGGGTIQIDNSYCQEIEILECSEMDESECNDNSSCEWIEDIEIGQCSQFDNSENSCTTYPGECYWDEDITYASCDYPNSGICNSVEGCYWDCNYGYCDCNGQEITGVDTECIGQYEINNNYCDEVNYIPADINGDGNLNIADVILMVNLILNYNFNEYADMNQDGILNIIDIIELVNRILDR